MASYYKEMHRVNQYIARIIDVARANKKSLSINEIVFLVTNNFEVGENAIRKRLTLICQISKDFDINEDEITFK
jgi:hypothetical protein